MAEEDGVLGGLDHFLSSLHRDSMLCDVSLLLGEAKIAKYRLLDCRVKVSVEVAALINHDVSNMLRERLFRSRGIQDDWRRLTAYLTGLFRSRRSHRLERHARTTYAVGHVSSIRHGCAAGFYVFFFTIFRIPFEVFISSDKYARSHGACGCLFGLLFSPFQVIRTILLGLLNFFDRVGTGVANGVCGENWLFWIDRSEDVTVHSNAVSDELETFEPPKTWRRTELDCALEIALELRRLFERASPHYPDEHWHYYVVDTKRMQYILRRHLAHLVSLNETERECLRELLEKQDGETEMSFAKLCYITSVAIADRPKAYANWIKRASQGLLKSPSFAEQYLAHHQSSIDASLRGSSKKKA